MSNLNPEKLKTALTAMVQRVLLAERQSVNEAMLELYADYIDRIFKDGLDSDNGKIGNYSTKPIYVSLAGQTSQSKKSGLSPKGKGSKKGQRKQGVFKNGKPRKSQYFPDGYAGFRTAVGRQNAYVDLGVTFSLRGDIRVGRDGDNMNMSFTTDEQLLKASGNETRFGKTIFDPTEQEIQIVVDRYEEEVTEAFFSAFE